jgi:Uma2 family endonuclease
MATTTGRLTAEEFFRLPDSGRLSELVRGVEVMMDPPGFRHGEVCGQAAYLLADFLDGRELGRAISNNAGVVTERDPDTVRGPDISYYSFVRMPRGPAPIGYAPSPPDVVFEVLSPSDSRPELLAKVAEYLKTGVLAAAVFDPEGRTIHIYRPNSPATSLTADDTLALSEIGKEFCIRAAHFFE